MDKPKCWVTIFIKTGWVCPYLTQTWVETTQHFFLECRNTRFTFSHP